MEFSNMTALIKSTNDTKLTEEPLTKILSTAAASLSLLGSSIIIITYWMWPDLRTTSRKMIIFIAIGDFLLATTNIVTSWKASSQSYIYTNKCEASIPKIIALLLTFTWTAHLSFFFYLTICRRISLESEKRVMRFFHFTGWGIPCVVALISFFLKREGFAASLITKWTCCQKLPSNKTIVDVVLWMFITEKGWELIAYITITVFYVLVKLHIKRELSARFTPGSPFLTMESADIARKVDYKLTLIPVAFFLARIWGTISFFRLIACLPECREIGTMRTAEWLAILSGIGDNIQGFTNFILFGLFTTKIRERLRSGCINYLSVCCRCLKKEQPVAQRVKFYNTFDNK